MGGKGLALSGGSSAYIAVDARATISTESVRGMAIKRRNCIKSDEDKQDMLDAGITLEVFANYSRPACITECRAREIFDKCGCLPYYYPNFALVWGKDTACDTNGLKCVAEQSSKLTSFNWDFSNYVDF